MHLVVAITPHGFGHAAQVAPVINALRENIQSLQITLLTSVPEAFLRERIAGEFRLIEHTADFGLIMKSALAIDLARSAEAYIAAHHAWEHRVEAEARLLLSLAPDLVLADIPYLTLAAAHQAGIPAIALCSLNWADIYRYYFSDIAESGRILEQMRTAYRHAAAFLCPEPSMPMEFLDNRVAIGVIARQGHKRGAALRDRLGIGADQTVVAVAPGGIKSRFAMESWPRSQGIHWLVSKSWEIEHADASALEDLDWSFTDILASCDAVLGKCGYGTVTECVANGTPLLYVPRPDWPEEQSLASWLHAHDAGIAVEPQRLLSGVFADLVEHARSLSIKTCAAHGAAEAAALMERYLTGQSVAAGGDRSASVAALRRAQDS